MTEETAKRERLRRIIAERSLRRDRVFKLASGRESNYFFNLKPTMLDPEGINLAADAILARIAELDAQYVGGLVMGAVPLMAAIVTKSAGTPHPLTGFWVRKERKDHGAEELIDGELRPGARAVIVEDVTTTGGSVLKAIREVRAKGCAIAAVITVVDRLEGAKAALAQEGIDLIALYTTEDF